MDHFQFEGEFLCVDFDFTKETEHELVVEFGDIRIPSEFYWWFVHVDLLPKPTVSQRVRDLHDSKEHGTAFGLMMIRMLDAWNDIVEAGNGNLLVSFFDEYCDIFRVRPVDDSTTRLIPYWTSEPEIALDHPIDLQTKYGAMPDIETLESDEPDQRVETAILSTDLDQASEQLGAWVNS